MGTSATKAKNKYNVKSYDRIALNVKKGQREAIKAYAEAQGLSINSYINKLIEADMKQGL